MIEKMKPFNHRVSEETRRLFDAQCKERRYNKTSVVDVAIRLWIDLPRHTQSDLLAGEIDGNGVVSLIQETIRQELKKRNP